MVASYRRTYLLLILAGIILFGCQNNGDSDRPFDVFQPENPTAAGGRLLGINISESIEGFHDSFAVAQQAGIEVVELNIPWDYLEPTIGDYQDPFGWLPATTFYGANNVQVAFSLAVVDTVTDRLPADLRGLAYDSSEIITAFENLLDWFMGQVPANVSVPGISIGNEVDLVLDDTTWPAYTEFYRQISAYIQANWPQINVGVKTTVMHGIFGSSLRRVQIINQHSDVVMLTYYPQDGQFQVLDPNVVHSHFEQLIDAFPGQDIWLMEVGYQSGENYCDSSETRQALFFHEFFKAWDDRGSRIKFVIIDWLHDQSPAKITEWENYYGSSDPAFVEYLSTLGLRNHDNTDKLAWLQILTETSARGW